MQSNRENQAEALLNHVNRYQAGRLTVFLGAAPGVGKPMPCSPAPKNYFNRAQMLLLVLLKPMEESKL